LVAPDLWLQNAQRVEPFVRQIQSKGGRVAFVRFPSSGETSQLECRHFPKEKCWNQFAASTSAIAIHWLDVPQLAKIDCPDTMHLDWRDADRFTSDLIDELLLRGALPNHAVDVPTGDSDGR
jgi:hypothetical protein